MRATWLLATNNWAGRPVRTGLLLGAIIASVALMIAVASMLETVDRTHQLSLGRMFGLAQLRVTHRYQQRIDQSLMAKVQSWPGVTTVSPRFESILALHNPRTGQRETVQAVGVIPQAYDKVRPAKMAQGRMIRAANELVLDAKAFDKLGAKLGDTVEVVRFGDPVTLTLVGVVDRPELGSVQQPLGLIELEPAQRMAGLPGFVDELEILLTPHADPARMMIDHQADLPAMATVQTTASAGAGMSRGIVVARLLFMLIGVLVYIAAAFIIAASLTTAVTERLRELAILRSVGATRWQVAWAQLVSGAMLTAGGTALGVPVGLGAAYAMYWHYRDMLPGGFDPAMAIIALAMLASTLAGMTAAAYPAVIAARVSPVEGLAARAKKPSAWRVAWCGLGGLACLGLPMAVFYLPLDTQTVFWFFMWAGIALILIGFFLLSVPMVLGIAWLLHRPMGWLLGVPGTLLWQSVSATPYRNGMTAAALMIGLAVLVNIWIGGRSFLAGWFDQLRMPDAFVHSPTPVPDMQMRALRDLPFVTDVCAVTAFPVPTTGIQFGVKRFAPKQTLYVACDAPSFVKMTNLIWVEGQMEQALEAMKQGQAVLVSQEFLAVHRIGLDDTLTLETRYGPQPFKVVGVVASPGIDVATQFYGLGRNYASASIGSIIGTNTDAIHFWGVDSANLVLISVDEQVNDKIVLSEIRRVMPGLMRSSARRIRQQVYEAANQLMGVASAVAGVGLVIACLGVGNLILAGIHARRFEFGVLRSIGGSKAMLCRLMLGQSLLIAITACLLGLAMGVQVSAVGQRIYQSMLGVHYSLILPWDVIALGSIALGVAAILATLPALAHLWRVHPRHLLAAD